MLFHIHLNCEDPVLLYTVLLSRNESVPSAVIVHFPPQMRISYDDQFLFSVGQDGSLLALRVTDKDGRGLKREKDITFAEEVLVMKTDLEEKVSGDISG